jgi:hypothetical protein
VPHRATVSPDAAVRGGVILSALSAMGPFRKRGEQALAEHGIGAVDVEEWYPLGSYLEALEAIGERMGPNTLFQVGRQIPRHVALPAGLNSFATVLSAFGTTYGTSHRGVPEGAVTHQLLSDRSGRITSATPYPCDLDRGVIVGLFQHLLDVRVFVEEEGGCAKAEGGCCAYLIKLPLEQ